MIIAGSLVIICGMLLLGVIDYVAFGAVLLFLAAMGGHEVSGYLPSGSTKLRSLVLMAIPLFMIAGTIMERGKIAAPLVSLAELFIGHLKGGLSAATVLACGIFGSISGAANATVPDQSVGIVSIRGHRQTIFFGLNHDVAGGISSSCGSVETNLREIACGIRTENINSVTQDIGIAVA